MSISPIILHIPHTSIVIPQDQRDKIVLSDEALASEILYMTDSHTGELYEYAPATRVEFPVSRLIVDPERFEDDAQEPMAPRGMGVIYTITSHLEKLREKPTEEERKYLLDTYYHPHHKTLTDETDKALEKFGKCLIIDCHSFPSRTLPYELKDGQESRPEICIGTDEFHSPPEIASILEEFFTGEGYSFDVNTPFAGSLTPLKHYSKEPNVMSVMFEIRRDIYMDESNGLQSERFAKVKADITSAIHKLDEWLKSV